VERVYDLRVTVEQVKGFCDLPMRPGDYFEVRGGRVTLPPGGHICLWALAALLPMLPAKQRRTAEDNDWLPRVRHMSCPDPDGMVIYRIDRLGLDDAAQGGDGAAAHAGGANLPAQRLLVREEICSGCTACEFACSAVHNDGVFQPSLARIHIHKDEAAGIDRPLVCRQCGQAKCVEACAAGALSRSRDTGAVLIDASLCAKCGECAVACPFDAIRFAAGSGLPLICDLCGGDPACVKSCATGALKYGRAGESLPAAPAEPYLTPPELPRVPEAGQSDAEGGDGP